MKTNRNQVGNGFLGVFTKNIRLDAFQAFRDALKTWLSSVGGERLAVDGERLAVDGERLAVDGERLAVDGERLAVDGERLAVDGERLAVDGQRSAIDGERLAAVQKSYSAGFQFTVNHHRNRI